MALYLRQSPDEAIMTYDEDDYRDPWCKDFDNHKAAHLFCDDHQAMWCRLCVGLVAVAR